MAKAYIYTLECLKAISMTSTGSPSYISAVLPRARFVIFKYDCGGQTDRVLPILVFELIWLKHREDCTKTPFFSD